MKRLTLLTAIGLVLGAISTAESQTAVGTSGARPAPTASANLVDAQGRSMGQAYLQQTPHGVLIKLELKNATPGIHALHIHDVGRCDRPTFESAGDHLNPSGRQHGFMNTQGPHTGDLPNIDVPSTTQLAVEHFVAGVTIASGPRSLIDTNGSSLVIHSGKDDHATDPAGESGERLACGAIVPSAAPSVRQP
jgi:Cu-Zn family superoxide dismutase